MLDGEGGELFEFVGGPVAEVEWTGFAAFEGVAWRADNSPFDRYLRGDKGAMSKNAIKGMKLFYFGDGKGQACA